MTDYLDDLLRPTDGDGRKKQAPGFCPAEAAVNRAEMELRSQSAEFAAGLMPGGPGMPVLFTDEDVSPPTWNAEDFPGCNTPEEASAQIKAAYVAAASKFNEGIALARSLGAKDDTWKTDPHKVEILRLLDFVFGV